VNFAYRKAWYVASARIAFRMESWAGVGVTFFSVAKVFVYRLGASMDLSRALVDVIVDVDLTDMVSFPYILSLRGRSEDVIVGSSQYTSDLKFSSRWGHKELRSRGMTLKTSSVWGAMQRVDKV
jgi:hypothetical protein